MKYKRIIKHKFLNSNEKEKIKGKWSDDEHNKFLIAINLYRKNWKKIEEYIKTRTASQIRSHSQKFYKNSPWNDSNLSQLNKETILSETINKNEFSNFKEKNNKESDYNEESNNSINTDSEDQDKNNIYDNDSISEEVINISNDNNFNYISKNQIFKSFLEQMKVIISNIKGNSNIEKKLKIIQIWKEITLNMKNLYKNFKNEDDNFNGKLEYNFILNEIKTLSKEIKFNIKNPYLIIYNNKLDNGKEDIELKDHNIIN